MGHGGPPFHPAVLPDGRRLVMEWGRGAESKHFGWLSLLILLAALGSYPISRRLTRRIEALTTQAEAWLEVAGLFLIPLSDDPWAYDDLIPTGADGAARIAQEDVLDPVFAVMPALGISFAP